MSLAESGLQPTAASNAAVRRMGLHAITAFRHWEAASELSRCPLLPETTRDDALMLILRLRAEAAFRLGRYEEVRTIATRLGHRYEQIENLLKRIDP